MPLDTPLANEVKRFTEGCGTRMGKSLLEGAAMGIFIGAGFLAWFPDPYRFDVKGTVVPKAQGFRYIIGGMKAPMMWTAIACTTYSGVECVMEQLRDESKSSTWFNSATAGAATGVVIGSMSKRIDIMATTALGLGMLMGLVEFNGQGALNKKSPRTLSSVLKELSEPSQDSTTVKSLKEKYPEYKDL